MNKIELCKYRLKVRNELMNLPEELFRATELEIKKEHERRYNKAHKEWSK